jgi:hypothetical protein
MPTSFEQESFFEGFFIDLFIYHTAQKTVLKILYRHQRLFSHLECAAQECLQECLQFLEQYISEFLGSIPAQITLTPLPISSQDEVRSGEQSEIIILRGSPIQSLRKMLALRELLKISKSFSEKEEACHALHELS